MVGEEEAAQTTPNSALTSYAEKRLEEEIASDDKNSVQLDQNPISEGGMIESTSCLTMEISQPKPSEIKLGADKVSNPQSDKKISSEGGIKQITPSSNKVNSEPCPAVVEQRSTNIIKNNPKYSYQNGLITNKNKAKEGLKGKQDSPDNLSIKDGISASCKINLEKKQEVRPQSNEAKDIIPLILKNSSKVIVSILHQKMYVLFDNKHFREYPVSTSKYGVGDEFGSYKTPTGIFRVHSKYGDGLNIGAVLKSRKPTREIVSPNSKDRDPIVTRIIWLEGLESSNRHAFERCIYIHGTPQETNLGRPASFGCIRMASKDVLQVYEVLPQQSCVAILNEFDKKTLKKLRFIEDKSAS